MEFIIEDAIWRCLHTDSLRTGAVIVNAVAVTDTIGAGVL
jgi:hypothetical protein